MTEPALAVENLTIARRGRPPVVEGVSFVVARGERLALVGESGSGKTMSALAVIGLLPPGFAVAAGTVRIAGRAIDPLSPAMRRVRGREVAVVFQDPMTALNPVMTVGDQIVEALRAHRRDLSRAEAEARAVELLDEVRIARARDRLRAFPHEFSGGMRQRVTIAIALANRPALLIADEPTTALDVTTQARILGLLDELCRERGTGLLLITHDLGIVQGFCDQVCVLYAGAVMEQGPVARVLVRPEHPYTRGLLRSVPPGDRDVEWLEPIRGEPPNALARGEACRFAPRCPEVFGRCREEVPLLRPGSGGAVAACHLVGPAAAKSREDARVGAR